MNSIYSDKAIFPFLCSLFVIGALNGPLQTHGREILSNGGFEKNIVFLDPVTMEPVETQFAQNWEIAPGGGSGGLGLPPAARTGERGLWIFTGTANEETFVRAFQDISLDPGIGPLTASAYVRTHPEQPFLPGSEAYFLIEFLNATNLVLGSHQSAILSVRNNDWTRLELTTSVSPPGTVRVRFTCFLSKPENLGPGLQSLVNFDDCSLEGPLGLLNPGFEDNFFAEIGGEFLGPFARHWWPTAAFGEAGALSILPEDQSDNVLWQFTGAPTNQNLVASFQNLLISPGAAVHGSIWVRTPPAPNDLWVPDSRAFIMVHFLNRNYSVLASSTNSIEFTVPNTNWNQLEVWTTAAPPGTVYARLSCYLIKPFGVEGLSLVNFDDAFLEETTEMPGARLDKRVIGITANETNATLILKNFGRAPLTWQVIEDVPWLIVTNSNGTLPALTEEIITINVNRTGVAGPDAVKGTIIVQTALEDFPVEVFMDMPSPPPPAMPAEVRIFGQQLRVRNRLPDGNLSAPYHYIIKGTAWSPASIGTTGSDDARREAFGEWYVADIQLMRAMNANTVYTFLIDTGPAGHAALDHLYKNGLMAIITVDEDGRGNTNRLAEVVTAFRNHPSVLAWAVGNEWNINFFKGSVTNVEEGAFLTEALAQQVKAIDPNHPVVAIYGDINIPGLNPLFIEDEGEGTNRLVSTERVVSELTPSVDFWGLNIYRGATFFDLFRDWDSITDKPMALTEFGTDAFRTLFYDVITGEEDETMQADHISSLWTEIEANLSATELDDVCLGGMVFEWNDEWWKTGEDNSQEALGFNSGGHPDFFANEEWFAIVGADRRQRQAYFDLQTAFGAVTALEDLDGDTLRDSWEYQIVDADPGDLIDGIATVRVGDDYDADGANNQLEHDADTNPLDSASLLRMVSVSVDGTDVTLRWTGGTAATQALERCDSLDTGSIWTAIQTFDPPTSIDGEYTDSGGAMTTGFYRIKIIPAGP